MREEVEREGTHLAPRAFARIRAARALTLFMSSLRYQTMKMAARFTKPRATKMAQMTLGGTAVVKGGQGGPSATAPPPALRRRSLCTCVPLTHAGSGQSKPTGGASSGWSRASSARCWRCA
jgi:hypothetical protein